jgi:hypothetical protein
MHRSRLPAKAREMARVMVARSPILSTSRGHTKDTGTNLNDGGRGGGRRTGLRKQAACLLYFFLHVGLIP